MLRQCFVPISTVVLVTIFPELTAFYPYTLISSQTSYTWNFNKWCSSRPGKPIETQHFYLDLDKSENNLIQIFSYSICRISFRIPINHWKYWYNFSTYWLESSSIFDECCYSMFKPISSVCVCINLTANSWLQERNEHLWNGAHHYIPRKVLEFYWPQDVWTL